MWEQRAEMLPCPHSLRLVHSGDGGPRDWKLIWDRGVQWKKRKEGQRHTEREREREVEKEFRETSGLAQAGSLGSPSLGPLFTHREISDNFTAPLSVAIEKGQIPSWLLTLYPVRVVAIMGKSKPLASSVGYLSALRYSLSANSSPE